jgi:hypothetical protein
VTRFKFFLGSGRSNAVGEGKIERKACFFAVSAVGICV